ACDPVVAALACLFAQPCAPDRGGGDEDSQNDRRLIDTLGFKIVVHDDYSFCFARALIRSATARGSMPIVAAVARTCFARLSAWACCARAPIAGGGFATKLPRPRTSGMAPGRSSSS